MSDPMDDAVNTVAEALWRVSFGPFVASEEWVDFKHRSPDAAAVLIVRARDVIRRARLIPQDDRIDLSLKRALVESDVTHK